MNFADKLITAVKEKGNAVCVGLDPRLKQLPAELKEELNPQDIDSVALAYEEFCKTVVDLVADLVPIVKPQSAFFEALGTPGVFALGNVVRYAREKGVLVLMDAKRGDIGSTAEAYAQAYLANGLSDLESDALTVNPYMGADTLEPFVESALNSSKGIFVLVKTSNPGSGHFQDRKLADTTEHLFELVADEVEKISSAAKGECGYGPVGAVVGATYPEQLAELRSRMPHVPLLIPGFGAQGGGVDDVKGGFDSNGLGAIVNSSRGIIFAYEQEKYQAVDWRTAIQEECRHTTEQLAVSNLAN